MKLSELIVKHITKHIPKAYWKTSFSDSIMISRDTSSYWASEYVIISIDDNKNTINCKRIGKDTGYKNINGQLKLTSEEEIIIHAAEPNSVEKIESAIINYIKFGTFRTDLQ